MILAPGSTIQVTREDEHMEHLAALLSRFGSETVVAASLRAVIEQRPRSTIEVVAVDIDGHQVGVLSPTQTANFLPLVRRAESEGRSLICRASSAGQLAEGRRRPTRPEGARTRRRGTRAALRHEPHLMLRL